MKRIVYLITYLAAAIIGVLLLVFNQQALYDVDAPALHATIVASGVIFVIPGVVLLFATLRPVRNAEGVVVTKPWYRTVMAIVALLWGIALLALPRLFTELLPITVGVSLIIAGFASTGWTFTASRPYGIAAWWYVVPILVFCAGICCIAFVYDPSVAMKSASRAAVTGGVALICLGANGISALNRARHIRKQARAEEKAAAAAKAEEKKK